MRLKMDWLWGLFHFINNNEPFPTWSNVKWKKICPWSTKLPQNPICIFSTPSIFSGSWVWEGSCCMIINFNKRSENWTGQCSSSLTNSSYTFLLKKNCYLVILSYLSCTFLCFSFLSSLFGSFTKKKKGLCGMHPHEKGHGVLLCIPGVYHSLPYSLETESVPEWGWQLARPSDPPVSYQQSWCQRHSRGCAGLLCLCWDLNSGPHVYTSKPRLLSSFPF